MEPCVTRAQVPGGKEWGVLTLGLEWGHGMGQGPACLCPIWGKEIWVTGW